MVPCVMINFLSNLKSLIYTQKIQLVIYWKLKRQFKAFQRDKSAKHQKYLIK